MNWKDIKTIAIVGLSDNPERPSYRVAEYLLKKGFNILPINPTIDSVLGIKAYKSIKEIPQEIVIDIVDIFRRSEEVETIVKDIIESKRHVIIWMQEGVVSPEAKKIAESKNMEVIMDMCIMKVHIKQDY
jgi:predicted CoA-binding protein